jgi:predicted PurR-regulated permease PerM
MAITGLSLGIMVALVAALIWGLGRVVDVLSPVLWPIAVAGVIAYILDPLVEFFQRKGLRRSRSITLVFLIMFLLFAGVSALVVPRLIRETRDLVERMPHYWNQLQERFENLLQHPPVFLQRFLDLPASSAAPPVVETNTAIVSSELPSTNQAPAVAVAAAPTIKKQTLQDATSRLAELLPQAGHWLFGQLGRVASGFAILLGVILVPVYAFYFLLEKQGISAGWPDYLPVSDSRFKEELVFILTSINNYLITFFRGQVLVAITDGILYGIGFLLAGIPYAVVIGAAAMVLTIVPFLGALIIFAASLVIAIVNFGDWKHPLLVVAVFAVVQTLEGLVISPKIMGDRVGLHPVTIIIAVMAGTALLGGLLGGILAIPLTAALRVMMIRYVWKRNTTQS